MLSKTDLEICARTVAELGNDEAEDVRASLAWVIRNRIERLRAALGEAPPIAATCAGILREALPNMHDLPQRNRVVSARCPHIEAATSLVWAGDVADRTGGAVACHRHDISPAWARKRTPTALLGAFLFFR
jgi:hypothetical protein